MDTSSFKLRVSVAKWTLRVSQEICVRHACHGGDSGDVLSCLIQSWDGVVGRCCKVDLQFPGLVKDRFSNLDALKDRIDQMVIGSVQIELVTYLNIAVCSHKGSVM